MAEGIRKQLETALRDGTLVEVHHDPNDWQLCEVGYVDALFEDSVRIRSVTTRGETMGFEVHLLASIVGVMTDDGDNDYLDKIARLTMRPGEFADVPPLPHGGLTATLREAMHRQRVVKIVRAYGEGDALCGIVRAMTDDTMSIQTVDQYGEDAGLATVPMSGIVSVHLGTEDEQILDYLRESYARDPDARLVG